MDRFRFNEGSSGTITATILDQAGNAVPLASISAATLTLYDMDTAVMGASPAEGILNDRNGQDVKNANNVTIHATSGLLTWSVQPEDNVIVTERRQVERHRALFVITATTPTVPYECELEVVNLRMAS